MSIQAMSWVFESSEATGNDRCVMFAIANHFAAKEPWRCWPGLSNIAQEARVSVRTAQRSIERLVALGELLVYPGLGGSLAASLTTDLRADRRPNLYVIPAMTGWRPDGVSDCHPVTGRQNGRDGVTETAERGDRNSRDGVTPVSSYPVSDPLLDPLEIPPIVPQPLKPVPAAAPSGGVVELPGFPSPFQQFYDAYPIHKGRTAALKAWNKAVHHVAADRLIRKAKEYAADPNRVDEYTPYPQKWLNEGRWDDDPCLPRNGAGPQSHQHRVDTDRDAPAGQMWIHPDGQWRYHPPGEAEHAGR